MSEPLKPSIQQDFRVELGTNSSPSSFDPTVPPLPVAIIAGNIGFPKPRSNQTLKTYYFQHGVDTEVTISTPNALMNVYFVGMTVEVASGAGGSCNFHVLDRSSGTTRTTGDTDIIIFRQAATASTRYQFTDFMPLPVKLKTALRLYTDVTVNGAAEGVIYYIEETLNN